MKDFLAFFEETKEIYGFCPCCDDLFRLSDVTLYTKNPPPQTPFDRIQEEQLRLDDQIQRFEERESGIRQKSKMRGQEAAKGHLKKILPFFFGQKINLNDVKVLFDPVKYVLFKGLNDANCSSVEFVDHPAESKEKELIHKSLDRTIRAGNLEWHTFRIDDDGRCVKEIP